MTAKEQGLPELPPKDVDLEVIGMDSGGDYVVASNTCLEVGTKLYTQPPAQASGVDAGFIEAAKCARRALARACTASPEYTRAYEQLDAAITAAALTQGGGNGR